jgi:hypothetical protein
MFDAHESIPKGRIGSMIAIERDSMLKVVVRCCVDPAGEWG